MAGEVTGTRSFSIINSDCNYGLKRTLIEAKAVYGIYASRREIA